MERKSLIAIETTILLIFSAYVLKRPIVEDGCFEFSHVTYCTCPGQGNRVFPSKSYTEWRVPSTVVETRNVRITCSCGIKCAFAAYTTHTIINIIFSARAYHIYTHRTRPVRRVFAPQYIIMLIDFDRTHFPTHDLRYNGRVMWGMTKWDVCSPLAASRVGWVADGSAVRIVRIRSL